MGFEERITKRLEKKKSKEIDPIEFRERHSPEKERFMKPYDDLVKEKMKAYGEFYDYEESVMADLESQKGKIKEGAERLAELEIEEKEKKKYTEDYGKELEKEMKEADVERLKIIEVVNKIKKILDDIKKVEKKIEAAEDQISGLDPKDTKSAKKIEQINKGITNKEGEIREKRKEITELKSKYKKSKLDEIKKRQEKATEKLNSEAEKLAELENADADVKERKEIEERVKDLVLGKEGKLTPSEDTGVDARERDKIENKIREFREDIEDLNEAEKELDENSFEDLVEKIGEQYLEIKERQIGIPDYRFLKTEAKRKEEQGKEERKRLRKTTKEFRRMKKRGVTVEDLKEAAKISSGTISKFYDTQERINNQIERGQKTRLFGEIIAGSTQIAFYSAKGVMAAPIFELRKGVRYNIAENISLGLYRIRSASRGLLFKKGPLAIGKGTWKISSVEETKKQAKKYKTPKDVPDPDKTNEEIIKGFERSMNESTKKVLESISTPPELASETADRVFKHMAEAYKFYVDSGTDDEEGVNKLFKTMREAGLKPEIFEKESAYLKQLIVKIEEWTKQVDTMSREKAKQELETFWDTVVGATTGKDLGKADIVKKLAENIYIGFLLNEKSQKRS